jgi:tetratricopeptide (TPR) repeat protein
MMSGFLSFNPTYKGVYFMDLFGSIIGGIAKVAGAIAPGLMAVNQTRAITNQTQSLALAQKRDSDARDLGIKRMEFDAKMEIMRQTVRAKERQEDKEFSLQLKAIEAENLFCIEILRQEIRSKERQEDKEFSLILENVRTENQVKVEKIRQAFNALEAQKQREFTQAIEKFKAEVQIALQADSIAFQRWKTETDRDFSLEITLLNAQINRQRDKQNRDDSRRDRNSPVFSVADDILKTVENRPEMPLTVFFSPPVLRYDPIPNAAAQSQFPMMESTLSGALRQLFKQYTLKQRPVKFMAGEWVTKNRRAEAAVNQIFSELNSIPVLVLETEVEESFFNINIGFWNNDFDDARFETVVRKFRWQDAIAEISQNLLKKWQTQGRQIQTDYDRAEFNRGSRETFTHYMEVLHCLHVGMVADEYFLIYAQYRQLPLLPSLLSDLFDEANLDDEECLKLTKAVIDYCNALFDALEQTESAIMVDLRLQWAKILQDIPSRYGFAEQVVNIMQTWLKQRNLVSQKNLVSTITDLVAEISKNLLPEDANFVNDINNLLQILGETRFLNIALSCFQRGLEHLQAKRYDLARIDFDRAISLNPQSDVYYQRAIACYQLQDYSQVIADLDKATTLQPHRGEFYDLRGDAYLKLSNYEMALANYNQAVTLGHPNNKLADLQREWNNKLRQEEEARKRREAEEARKRAEAQAEAARKQAEEERKKREAEAKFPQLAQFLAQGEWRKADEETNRVMCKIMGGESEGYLNEDNCKNFPREELKIIDDLWVKHSNGKFGFSVQKKIYQDCGGTPGEYNSNAWYKLAETVGWCDRGHWLCSYDGYTFNTNALHGHLPARVFRCEGKGYFSFLASKL